MKKEYDIVFLATFPSFYRNSLINKIAEKSKILVIFIAKTNHPKRNNDFYGSEINFDHLYLTEGNYPNRNKVKNAIEIIKVLKKIKYKVFILIQWDTLEGWLFNFLVPKKKACIVMESSICESTVTGFKGWMKKLYVSKIKYGLPSGKLQQELLEAVGMNSKFLYKTKGVGIFERKKTTDFIKSTEKINDFLFVGRLSKEKNIEQIIRVFNKLPELNLTIVGSGPLEEALKEKATKNIIFKGYQSKSEMNKIYSQHHVFVLPSIMEAWGLVVEEALYNGIPVVLSDKIGCVGEIMNDGIEGYIYDVTSDKDLEEQIIKVTDLSNYKKLKDNIVKINFDKRDEEQVNVYHKLVDKVEVEL